MALICGFAAIFGATAPAGAATESFTLTSASLPGQDSVTWQGPPLTGTPNVFPSTVSLSGQIDSTTGNISGATLSLPPLPQPEQQGENTTFTFSEVNPGTATGNFNSSTGAVTLNDSLTLTFTGTGLAAITCVSTPINVALSGSWNSTTQDVTLATASSFTIPQFSPNSGPGCGAASPSLNASPGGVSGSVGNAMSLELNGKFAPGLPTTTTLAANPASPQLAGTSVTLTATVVDPSAQGTPTGNVNFDANGAVVGTEALSPSGTTGTATATLTATNLPQAANQLTAVYAGDTTYAGSASAAVPYTIQALPTISSTFPSQFTAGTTSFPTPTPFTLTISNPAGGATYDNNLFLYLGIGSYRENLATANIQLAYQDEAGSWCSMATSVQATSVGLPSSLQSYYYGGLFSGEGTPPCGFAPAFSLDSGASLTLNLEIAFASTNSYAGPISLITGLQTGTCTSSTSCTAVAPLTGNGAVVSQAQATVLPQAGAGTIPSTVVAYGWKAGATIRSGNDVGLSVEVEPATTSHYVGAPTGTVQFFIDGQLADTLALNPTTSATNIAANRPEVYYNPGLLTPGTHVETVNYSGDLVYAPSSLVNSFTVVAGPPPGMPYVCAIVGDEGGSATNFNAYVTATGAGFPTAATSGTSVTVSDVSVTLDLDAVAATTAIINTGQSSESMGFLPGGGFIDPGSVTFANNSPATDLIGTWSGLSTTVKITGNPGDVVPVAVGSISFNYGLGGSVSCIPVSQGAAIGSVSIIGTTLAVSPSGSASVGAPVTLTATVSPLPPPETGATGTNAGAPGQVDFYDGSTYLATATVVEPPTSSTTGTASFTTNALSVGDHQLTADWSGYSGVPSSTSNTVDYQVGAASAATLTSSANPANATNPVTFTATVNGSSGSPPPTGDVSFAVDGTAPAACQDVALSTASTPTAACALSLKAGTTHSVVATYSGDATYLGSSSAPLSQSMLPGTTSTLTTAKNPAPAGNVTFWDGVSASGGGAVPTGTVAFTVDAKPYAACANQPLGPGGGASCTLSFKAGTSHSVSATYGGSSSYSGSKSNTISLKVSGATSATKPKVAGGSATLGSGHTLTAGQSISVGSYKLTMQGDGNLVEYQGTKARWASGTSGHSGTSVTMQSDGNLVEYQGGHAIWASNTSGHAGAHLTLQGSDGNVVIYGPGGQAFWATGT